MSRMTTSTSRSSNEFSSTGRACNLMHARARTAGCRNGGGVSAEADPARSESAGHAWRRRPAGVCSDTPATAHIPVVILSANATPSQIERLLTAGAKNYLTKPFDIDPFLAVVDEFTAEAKRAPREFTPQATRSAGLLDCRRACRGRYHVAPTTPDTRCQAALTAGRARSHGIAGLASFFS